MAQDLLYEYFCRPILDNSVQGYNFVNTAVYAAIMLVLVVYVVYPFLKKQNIKVDFRFTLALMPFILFGSSLRVLTDMGLFTKTCNFLDPNFFTFTPGIWLLTATIALGAIWFSKKIGKSESSFQMMFGMIGLLLAAPIVLYELNIITQWSYFALGLAAVIGVTLATKIIVELKARGFFSDRMDILVVAGQALDGTATYIATNLLNCGEQHPLSGAILGVHPALFVLVKVLIAILILVFLKYDVKFENWKLSTALSESRDDNFTRFIKLALIILGFATGTRDLLTLGVGTCN